MSNQIMSPEEVTKKLNQLGKAILEISLANLDYSEHVFALKSTLVYLDARAERFFAQQLELERSKNQSKREQLQNTIEVLNSMGQIDLPPEKMN